MFVRQCYKDIMHLPIWGQQDIFFTGTPGIGKTVFRNYVIGAQIFVLGKSPGGKSSTYVMQIVNGNIVADSVKVVSSGESVGGYLSQLNPNSSIRGYYHYDTSEGCDINTLCTENSVCCHYTSPNEKAWNEKLKAHTSLLYLPGWSHDELERFFLSCGMNKTLLLKIGIKAEHIGVYKDSMLWFPGACKPLVPVSPSFLLRVKDLKSSVEHEYTVSMSAFRRVIHAEIDEFGSIPRNMFLSEICLTSYINRINSAVFDFPPTMQGGSLAESKNIRHRLLMYSRKEGLELPFEYYQCEYMLNWISKPIMMKATEALVKQYLAYVNSNYFSSIYHISARMDSNVIERMLVFCVAAKPDAFKMELRSEGTPVSRLPISSDKLYTFRSILDLETISVRCLSNDELEVFAVSGTDDTIAVPFNDYYPDVHAIAHITLKSAAGGKSVRMTAFINVTTSQEHEISPVALLNLKNLCTKIRGHGPIKSRREVGFFWVVQNKKFKLSSALSGLMCQFVVLEKSNKVTKAQKNRQNDSVEFTRTYASQNGISYSEANKCEDQKIRYKEYKKKQQQKEKG